MNLTEKLDLAIKLNETGSRDGAYAVTYNGKTSYKSTYMTNDEWLAFLEAMPADARREYGEGSGDELSEKNGRPPKMASYGSSSRMIYMLSRGKEDFRFEKKLPTTVGGKANLDGFYEDAGRYVFVEAKCREPYTAKNKATVSSRYEKLYEYINERMYGSLYIETEKSGCGRYINTKYFAEGELLERFDLKQMICHLLGIATGILCGSMEKKQIDFIYLLFDPTELDLPDDAKSVIEEIHEKTCLESTLVDFAELFRAILDFLMETKFSGAMTSEEADELALKFTFTLASQDFYPFLIG